MYPYSFFGNPFVSPKIVRRNNYKSFNKPLENTEHKKEDKLNYNLPVFEIMGIKLYNDDLLILALLLFLYEEDIHDQELFLSLILLLLS